MSLYLPAWHSHCTTARFTVRLSCSSEQWWSLETWTRSRGSSRDSFLRVSVSKATGLETLNIAKKRFIKISIIQRFFVGWICSKKLPKLVGKNARNVTKFKSEVMTTFFLKIRQNAQILKSRVSVSNFVSSLGQGVFDEASVSKF